MMDDPFEGDLRAEIEVALMRFREANERQVALLQGLTERSLRAYDKTHDPRIRNGLYFTLVELGELTSRAQTFADEIASDEPWEDE